VAVGDRVKGFESLTAIDFLSFAHSIQFLYIPYLHALRILCMTISGIHLNEVICQR
jgi:hypothetical protein